METLYRTRCCVTTLLYSAEIRIYFWFSKVGTISGVEAFSELDSNDSVKEK